MNVFLERTAKRKENFQVSPFIKMVQRYNKERASVFKVLHSDCPYTNAKYPHRKEIVV